MTVAAIGLFLCVAALGHGFLWTWIVNRLHAIGGARPLIKALTFLCVAAFAAIPIAVAWNLWTNRPASVEAAFPPDTWLGQYCWLAVFVPIPALIAKAWIEYHRYDPTVQINWTTDVRDVAKKLGHRPLVGVRARLMGAIPGNESLLVSIDRRRLAIPRLPSELVGLSIAHLGDLHMTGRIAQKYFDYVVDVTNSLRPDVIAITGDIVEDEACWPWLTESLGKLCAPLGVYFILGNHDLLVDAARTRTLLEEAGFVDLGGRALRTDWNGVPVVLAGNELPWLRPAADPATLATAKGARPPLRLVLSHSPDQFGWAARADADLVLAGHTHGGQVRLPLLEVLASPSLYGTLYSCGVFRRGPTVMHVTRGVSGENPWRWRCPPEIALLELVRPPQEKRDQRPE